MICKYEPRRFRNLREWEDYLDWRENQGRPYYPRWKLALDCVVITAAIAVLVVSIWCSMR